MTKRLEMDTLYHINDVLTSLMHELGIRFVNDDDEDAALNNATFAVATAFGLTKPEEPHCAACGGTIFETDSDISEPEPRISDDPN